MTEVIELNENPSFRKSVERLNQLQKAQERYIDFIGNMVPNQPVDDIKLGELAHELFRQRIAHWTEPLPKKVSQLPS